MSRRKTLGPRTAVALEALRALGAGVLLLPRTLVYLLRRRRLVAELAGDLSEPAEVEAAPPPTLPDRPLRVFLSCAEPSGEIHAVRVAGALRAELAGRRFQLVGLGGERLRSAGVETLADPLERAAMGSDVLKSLPFYLRLLTSVARSWRESPPDVCLFVDSPALHVPMAHMAKRYGIPVAHLATPQYWGWAPWRVRGYRRAVDLALSILPFEPSWFRRHGVRVAHVGHPLLDSPAFDQEATTPPVDGPLLLLPGSRSSVIARNLPWMIATASRLRLSRPHTRVVLPHGRAELRPEIEAIVKASGASDWIEVDTGELHETLAKGSAALSVSGTVLLDLLHHRLPTVVVYRVPSGWKRFLARHLLTVPWFASVNLLAGHELLPEFLIRGQGESAEREVCEELLACYKDGPRRSERIAGLDEARKRLGPRGATLRAARFALGLVEAVQED